MATLRKYRDANTKRFTPPPDASLTRWAEQQAEKNRQRAKQAQHAANQESYSKMGVGDKHYYDPERRRTGKVEMGAEPTKPTMRSRAPASNVDPRVTVPMQSTTAAGNRSSIPREMVNRANAGDINALRQMRETQQRTDREVERKKLRDRTASVQAQHEKVAAQRAHKQATQPTLSPTQRAEFKGLNAELSQIQSEIARLNKLNTPQAKARVKELQGDMAAAQQLREEILANPAQDSGNVRETKAATEQATNAEQRAADEKKYGKKYEAGKSAAAGASKGPLDDLKAMADKGKAAVEEAADSFKQGVEEGKADVKQSRSTEGGSKEPLGRRAAESAKQGARKLRDKFAPVTNAVTHPVETAKGAAKTGGKKLLRGTKAVPAPLAALASARDIEDSIGTVADINAQRVANGEESTSVPKAAWLGFGDMAQKAAGLNLDDPNAAQTYQSLPAWQKPLVFAGGMMNSAYEGAKALVTDPVDTVSAIGDEIAYGAGKVKDFYTGGEQDAAAQTAQTQPQTKAKNDNLRAVNMANDFVSSGQAYDAWSKSQGLAPDAIPAGKVNYSADGTRVAATDGKGGIAEITSPGGNLRSRGGTFNVMPSAGVMSASPSNSADLHQMKLDNIRAGHGTVDAAGNYRSTTGRAGEQYQLEKTLRQAAEMEALAKGKLGGNPMAPKDFGETMQYLNFLQGQQENRTAEAGKSTALARDLAGIADPAERQRQTFTEALRVMNSANPDPNDPVVAMAANEIYQQLVGGAQDEYGLYDWATKNALSDEAKGNPNFAAWQLGSGAIPASTAYVGPDGNYVYKDDFQGRFANPQNGDMASTLAELLGRFERQRAGQ